MEPAACRVDANERHAREAEEACGIRTAGESFDEGCFHQIEIAPFRCGQILRVLTATMQPLPLGGQRSAIVAALRRMGVGMRRRMMMVVMPMRFAGILLEMHFRFLQ